VCGRNMKEMKEENKGTKRIKEWKKLISDEDAKK
jgi:hypothetical protein